ncbi:MAG: SPOR domain-containing protein [Sphingomonas sp.]|uniref:SPOR domain-containing protein n=1 Tax=Sphingomonas sp. TaxID=28214 RepID=UPI0017C5FAAF|nr:SPOR domain-containing protein [Sphingomonas sp.]MBA4772948.1 SPOR domain-containing protein [Sphingomonas sp.]
MAIHILALLSLVAAPSSQAIAQSGGENGAEVVAPPAPLADALANEMRVLAANPNDLGALLNAGELAVKLGDPAAAAGFFGRAEKIDPRSGRQRAGVASVLLLLERPGEALRRYGEAEAYGYDPIHYAADRGQAFDLVGDGARAQRDYRLALTRGGDDAEVRRRYALSLANSGDRDGALAQIAPLLQQSDRAAWRVRAFVLAITGDIGGAQDIATKMLPNGMAADLLPFFRRLAQLSPVDRAWAVHFGQLMPTPERLADARLAPSLPPLPVEPRQPPPVQLAAAPPVAKPVARGRPARRERAAPPVEVAAVKPAAKPVAAPPLVVSPPVAPVPVPVPVATPAKPEPVPVAPAVAPPTEPKPEPMPVAPTAAPLAPPVTPTSASGVAKADTAAAAAAAPVTTPIAAPAIAPVAPPPQTSPAAPPVEQESVAATTPVPPPGSNTESARVAGRESAILARIIAGIGVPAAELGVVPPVSRATPTPPPVEVRPAVDPEPPTPAAKPATGGETTKRDAFPDPRADAKRKAEEAKKAEARRKAEAEKAEAKRKAEAEAAEARKLAALAKASPSRIWVQVAGGASEGDLARAWAAVRAKAPAALRGQQGWTTPLRFTNRVLAGPFKSAAEAQKLVNDLTKAGVSSFVFTSAAGQKVDRLGGQ